MAIRFYLNSRAPRNQAQTLEALRAEVEGALASAETVSDLRTILRRLAELDDPARPVGVALVAIRGGDQVKVLTKLRVRPADWSPQRQGLRARAPGAVSVNAQLDTFRAEGAQLLAEYHTRDELKTALRRLVGRQEREPVPVEKVPTIIENFDQFVETKRARCQESTIEVYEGLAGHLHGFLSDGGGTAGEIGPGWLEDFAAYLVGEGLANSTTNKLLARTKGFLRWLHARGLLASLPAAKPLPTANNFALFLSAEELSAVASVDLAEFPPGHTAARDLFVFAAVTGQRYADMQAMRWEDLRENGDGRFHTWRLHVSKTNDALPVPLAGPAAEIIARRRGESRPLPALSNQKANGFIKEVCHRAEITEPVTRHRMLGGKRVTETKPKHAFISTHVARKTFITLALQAGLSMNELLGFTHQDLKQLKVYAGQDHHRLRAALHDVFDHLNGARQ